MMGSRRWRLRHAGSGLAVAGILCYGTPTVSWGDTALHEPFEYVEHAALTNTWVPVQSGLFSNGIMLVEGLTWPTLADVAGSAAGFPEETEESRWVAAGPGITNPSGNAVTLYVSALVEPVNTDPGAGWGSQPVSLYLTDAADAYSHGAWFGIIQDGQPGSPTRYADHFAICVDGRPDRNFGDPSISVVPTNRILPETGQTYLMLAKYVFNGSDSVSASLKVYTDPAALLPTVDPAWDVTHMDGDVDWPLSSPDYVFNVVGLRRDNTSNTAVFDELRVGPDLADVLPPFKPAGFVLTIQ